MTRRRLGFWFRLAVVLLRRPMLLLTKRDWRGAEHLPAHGGVIVITNHVSHFDPLAFAHFLYDNGRPPRFLAKAAIFDVPFVGTVLRGAGQIPVFRESTDASKAFSAAVDAVRGGECVAFYPEATITRDEGLWPMVGKTGAARVALATGAPVVPIAQWGPQDVLAPYSKRFRLIPRKTMHLLAGPPVDLSPYIGRPVDAELLRVVTEELMAAITALLEEVRGEKAPSVRFDPRKMGVPTTGNPRRNAKDGRKSA